MGMSVGQWERGNGFGNQDGGLGWWKKCINWDGRNLGQKAGGSQDEGKAELEKQDGRKQNGKTKLGELERESRDRDSRQQEEGWRSRVETWRDGAGGSKGKGGEEGHGGLVGAAGGPVPYLPVLHEVSPHAGAVAAAHEDVVGEEVDAGERAGEFATRWFVVVAHVGHHVVKAQHLVALVGLPQARVERNLGAVEGGDVPPRTRPWRSWWSRSTRFTWWSPRSRWSGGAPNASTPFAPRFSLCPR